MSKMNPFVGKLFKAHEQREKLHNAIIAKSNRIKSAMGIDSMHVEDAHDLKFKWETKSMTVKPMKKRLNGKMTYYLAIETELAFEKALDLLARISKGK